MLMILLLLLAFGSALTVSGASAGEIDLTSPPRYSGYEYRPESRGEVMRLASPLTGDAVILVDVDGDGWDDIVRSGNAYLAAFGPADSGQVTYYQKNLPPAFLDPDPGHASAGLFAAGDLDGDGRANLIAWFHTPDGSRWRFWNLDPRDASLISEFELAGGADVRPDGRWDGEYFVFGTLDVVADGRSIRALAVGCTVGLDKYGRGVLAVDPRDGRVLWRSEIGPNPYRQNMQVVDLDNDGSAEVVLFARSPDNLHGEEINGYSDDESRLFVLDADGSTRWSVGLAGSFGSGSMIVADLDYDGRPEIVTAVMTTPTVWGEIAVWDTNGRARARLAGTSQFISISPVQRQGRARLSLLATTHTQQLLEYEFTGTELIVRRTANLSAPGNIALVADLAPAPGTEVIIGQLRAPMLVLDESLHILATAPDIGNAWVWRAVMWQVAADHSLILWPSSPGPLGRLVALPFAWARLMPVGLGALALALFATVYATSRRPRRLNAHLLHETRLHLLDNLELSNHGAIAPLKCVRRLVWHLRALQTDLGENAKVEIRMRETWTECRESAVPHLKGILDRARLSGLADEHIDTVAGATAEIEKHLDLLVQHNFRAARQPLVAESLELAERQADAALLKLRAEVAAHFRADVARVVQRVRQANELTLAQNRIEVRLGQALAAAAGGTDADAAASPPLTALCDPLELEFVLDNLVGNAIEAMKDSAVRRLALEWRAADGMVLIDVTDSGSGIREADWDRVLNSRFSSKPAGGEGLPTSRKHLRKYGGNLTIRQSAPGRGTTFRVTLPAN